MPVARGLMAWKCIECRVGQLTPFKVPEQYKEQYKTRQSYDLTLQIINSLEHQHVHRMGMPGLGQRLKRVWFDCFQFQIRHSLRLPNSDTWLIKSQYPPGANILHLMDQNPGGTGHNKIAKSYWSSIPKCGRNRPSGNQFHGLLEHLQFTIDLQLIFRLKHPFMMG